MSLFRLHEKGTIRRVLPGIYDCPRYRQTLKENMAAAAGQFARALAPKHRRKIVPDGERALHLRGLLEQIGRTGVKRWNTMRLVD